MLYIGAGRGRNGQGVKGIKGGGMARGLGKKRPEVDDGLTRRSHQSVGSTCQWKRESRCVPIRYPSWAAGWFLLVGRKGSRGPFLFSSFLFFYFQICFQFFCKTPSKQFKQNSKSF
jgi:hypothetical protein